MLVVDAERGVEVGEDLRSRGPVLALMQFRAARRGPRTGGRAGCRMAADYTVGVEEEYQLVDAMTGAMCSRARDVLSTDWSEEIRPELQETTLEIGTPICRSATRSWIERLRRLRFQVAVTAAVDDSRS